MLRLLDDQQPLRLSPEPTREGGRLFRFPAPRRVGATRAVKVYANEVLGGSALHLPMALDRGVLSETQRWDLYTLCADFRAAVDSIARRLATWEWRLAPSAAIAADDPRRARAAELAAELTVFLRRPSVDGLSWPHIVSIVAKDWIVQGAGALYLPHVKSVTLAGRRIAEVTWLPGARVVPRLDQATGRYVGWDYWSDTADVAEALALDEIAFLPYEPTSRQSVPTPVTDTIWMEILSLMRGTDRFLREVDADEVGDGLLVVEGVSGPGAEDLQADLRARAGRTNELRMVTAPRKDSIDVRWVEFKRAFEDLQYADVRRDIRRTIWRVLGVQPVEMGDTDSANKATAAVTIDAGESHLLDPFTEALEAAINGAVLPGLVAEEDQGLVEWRYVKDRRLTPAERKDQAAEHQIRLRDGVITVNEARTAAGLAPLGPEGDVSRVQTPTGWVPLAALPMDGAAPSAEEPAAPREHDEVGGPATRANGLPSGWPSAEVFKGYRTLDLTALADEVRLYDGEVRPLWRTARDETVALVVSHLDGRRDLLGTLADVQAALDALAEQWFAAVGPQYRKSARLARDAVSEWLGEPALDDYADRAAVYAEAARGYARAEGGPLVAIHRAVAALLTGVLRSRPMLAVSQALTVRVSAEEAEAELLAAVAGVFDRQEHRVANWAGKLVDLSSGLAMTTLAERSEPAAPEREWMGEWVSVGDELMCATCTLEGTLGFRPLAEFRFQPGGATECGARCRCVVVVWTREEVNTGKAVRLGPLESAA